MSTAIDDIRDELKRANEKFPAFNSAHEGIAVIREEYLELEKEVFWGPTQGLFFGLTGQPVDLERYRLAREEAVQLGAMAAKMIDFIDAKVGGDE